MQIQVELDVYVADEFFPVISLRKKKKKEKKNDRKQIVTRKIIGR